MKADVRGTKSSGNGTKLFITPAFLSKDLLSGAALVICYPYCICQCVSLFFLFNFVLVQYFNVFFLRSFRTESLLLLRVKAQHLLALLLPSFKSRMFASCQPSIGISKQSPTDHLQEQKTALSACTFTVLSLKYRGFWTTRNTPYVLQKGLGLKPGASCGKTVYFLITTKIVIEFPSLYQ